MEALIVAVGLYLVYVVLDKFSPTIEGVVDIANGKVERAKEDQETKNLKASVKNTKARTKIQEEVGELGELISAKDLRKLLKGKIKGEEKDN